MPEVHYIKNTTGDVHSVDHEHFEKYCHTTVRGISYMNPGWSELTEEEARAANPQLFGARDRSIVHNAPEIQELIAKRALQDEMAKWDEADYPA